jgi:hypothetical protein
MSVRDAIRSLRETVKALAAEQKGAKASRKGCSAERMPTLWEEIRRRSVRITACLNYHHALRGSETRHQVQDGYLDQKVTEDLVRRFEVKMTA